MRVLICGIDGYLGWSLAHELLHAPDRLGKYAGPYEIAGVDSLMRRQLVAKVGGVSPWPLPPFNDRMQSLSQVAKRPIWNWVLDVRDAKIVEAIANWRPDAIVDLAEMPSAPWSMRGHSEARETYSNNILGTLSILWAIREQGPDYRPHLIKLGTMGEYGTPNVPIPEGWCDCEKSGRRDRLMFPRKPGSFYHASKVCDTVTVEFACRTWGIRATDIMQGVVYGTRTPALIAHESRTRFDCDSDFGTVINRFCAQTVLGEPLTVYGRGGQTRGFLALQDSMQCLRLIIDNPPDDGEYRVINQLSQCYSVESLARSVARMAEVALGHRPEIVNLDNPRVEAESHWYAPACEILPRLGYRPSATLDATIFDMLMDLDSAKEQLEAVRPALLPKVRWR